MFIKGRYRLKQNKRRNDIKIDFPASLAQTTNPEHRILDIVTVIRGRWNNKMTHLCKDWMPAIFRDKNGSVSELCTVLEKLAYLCLPELVGEESLSTQQFYRRDLRSLHLNSSKSAMGVPEGYEVEANSGLIYSRVRDQTSYLLSSKTF